MAKMPKSLYGFLIPVFRKLWIRWPGRQIAKDRAKHFIKVGTYQNGKDKMERVWICQNCGLICREKEYSIDHINPVIDTVEGFINWDTYINRLLCHPDNLQLLCNPCHDKKTEEEGKIRKKHTFVKK